MCMNARSSPNCWRWFYRWFWKSWSIDFFMAGWIPWNITITVIFVFNGTFEHRIRTGLGEFKMPFWRVSCSACGETLSPLRGSFTRDVIRRKPMNWESWLRKQLVRRITAVQFRNWHVMKNCRYRFIAISCTRIAIKTEISKRVIGSPLRFRWYLLDRIQRRRSQERFESDQR